MAYKITIDSYIVFRSGEEALVTSTNAVTNKIPYDDNIIELKHFLISLQDYFWLTCKGSRYTLANWKDGFDIYMNDVYGADFHAARQKIPDSMKYLIDKFEELSVGMGYDWRYAVYDIDLSVLSFTELVQLHVDITNLDITAPYCRHLQILLKCIRMTMFQYIDAAPWLLRRKIYKVLADDSISIKKEEMVDSFRTLAGK